MAEKTQDEFNRLLRRFDPDLEVAAHMYVTLQQKLAMFFRQNNCHPADDHADEALLRVARRDDIDDIRSIKAFAYGVARKMQFNIYEKSKKQVSIDSDPTGESISTGRSIESDIIEDIDKPRKARCARLCLQKLPADERTLIARYFMVADETRVKDRKRLSEEIGIKEGTLKTKVCRIRLDLERCARKCLATRNADLS